MSSSMDERIKSIWNQLENEARDDSIATKRRYKRLELGKETGLRLCCRLPDNAWELLVEIGSEIETSDLTFPNWKGMSFEILQLDLPALDTYHICLRLESAVHKDVFINVCSDIASALRDLESGHERKQTLMELLSKWSRFFERHGLQGLTSERQRGLYGELWWIRRLLNGGIKKLTVVHSWKGCERGYHDYELQGHVVEVKTTLSKEPRRVQINNERQLDDRGLVSLHLLALSLVQAERGGESLPDLVASLRASFISNPMVMNRFELCLHEAGYLNSHEYLYDKTYTVTSEELYEVREGFPAEVILRMADEQDCDAIIMGAHGKDKISYTFFGSTAKRVLRRTRKPVFIIPLPHGEIDISFHDE